MRLDLSRITMPHDLGLYDNFRKYGDPNMDPKILILIIGNPKKVPLILGSPRTGLQTAEACEDSCRVSRRLVVEPLDSNLMALANIPSNPQSMFRGVKQKQDISHVRAAISV